MVKPTLHSTRKKHPATLADLDRIENRVKAVELAIQSMAEKLPPEKPKPKSK